MKSIAITSPLNRSSSARVLSLGLKGAAILASLLVTACAQQYTPPQLMQANNPSVTYKYHTDQELLESNQNAMTYCRQYNFAARTAHVTDLGDGSKTVQYECMAMMSTPVPAPVFDPNLAYNYRSDQDLLDTSRNAEIYCMNAGSQRAVSTVVTNPNGTRSVTFRCIP